jgi:hypothetical protein
VTALSDDAASGGGVSLTQATVGNQPIYTASSPRFQYNPTLAFSGHWLTGASSPMTAIDNYTVFAVFQYNWNDTGHRTVWINGGASVGYGLCLTNTYETIMQFVSFNDTGIFAHTGQPVITCVQRAAGTTTFYRNGKALGATTTNTPSTPTQFWLGYAGSNGHFIGEIAEVAGYNENMTGGNRDAITAALGTTYGIAVE